MFHGERLGAARDNFSTNLARLKNLRKRFVDVHLARDAVLRQAIETSPEPRWMESVDLRWMAQEQREWLLNEHNTTLEMMFIYLVSMFDVFFGQWGAERNYWKGKWPAATPEKFREIGLPILPAVESQLMEYRARRDVLVHRGGIADARYCTQTGDQSSLGKRLVVTESYLDTAADSIDFIVAATAVARYDGPPRSEAQDLWPALIARVFLPREAQNT